MHQKSAMAQIVSSDVSISHKAGEATRGISLSSLLSSSASNASLLKSSAISYFLDAKIQFFWESPKIFSEKLDANALKAKK